MTRNLHVLLSSACGISLQIFVACIACAETQAVDYDHLLKQCDNSTDCCKTSVRRMKDTNSILMPGDKCPPGYVPHGLRCITSYQWCEPYTGRCVSKDQTGKCNQWQSKPVP